MINDLKILAIIPARGGSKGIPKKNIKSINGKPLIAWTIIEAQKSKYIDRIILSSDDEEIIKIAREYNCEVPFVRPSKYAADSTPSMDVIFHALKEVNSSNEYAICVMLEPTSPLRDAADIDSALEKLISEREAESVVGIARAESSHPAFLVSLKNGFIRSYLNNGFKFFRRQEIDELFYFEGSFYVSYVDSLKRRNSFYHDKCLGFELPKWKAFELDDEIDFIIIESLLKKKLNGELK